MRLIPRQKILKSGTNSFDFGPIATDSDRARIIARRPRGVAVHTRGACGWRKGKYSGYKYFTVKGIADKLNTENIVNGTPLIETGFDSDLFFTPENIQWTYPVYSFLGLTSNNTLTTAIPYGFQTLTLPQILDNTSVTNMVGYEMNSHTSFDKPYSPTLLSVYSKYNYAPQSSMVFLPSFIGQEATIHIRVIWGEAHSETKYYTLKIKFEN
jgi:hypothetical protein